MVSCAVVYLKLSHRQVSAADGQEDKERGVLHNAQNRTVQETMGMWKINAIAVLGVVSCFAQVVLLDVRYQFRT